MAYRFVIEKLLTAQVSTHADIAARLLDHLVKRKRHYDEVVLPALREMIAVPPPDRTIEGAWNATVAQLLAASADLLRLMEDARAQGVPNLRKRTGRSAGPKLDLTLTPPSSFDPREIAITLHVMQDGLGRAARDASDEINRLIAWLEVCADPAAQNLVEQLKQLGMQLRPVGVPPGPYAPGNVEAAGPPGHIALLLDFEVDIVATFKPEIDLLDRVLQVLPSDASGRPSLPLALGVDVTIPIADAPERSAFRATYAARGQNPDEARQYALGLFRRACSELALPEAVEVTVNIRAR